MPTHLREEENNKKINEKDQVVLHQKADISTGSPIQVPVWTKDKEVPYVQPVTVGWLFFPNLCIHWSKCEVKYKVGIDLSGH